MLKTLHFFGFLFFLTLIVFPLLFMRFFIWNQDFQKDFGLNPQMIRKATLEDSRRHRGEKTVFSLPIDYVSELRIDLVGESLRVEQVEGLSEIQVEIYYPEAVSGEMYTKLDYQLTSQGDRASFATDKTMWKSWKSEVSGKHKLLVGYVRIRIPTQLKTLRISSISGESNIEGHYSQLSFISFSGDLYFKGQSQQTTLETFEASMHLKGNQQNLFDFKTLHLRTVLGKLTGQGSVKDLHVTALSSALHWQGSWENFQGHFLFLRMYLVLDRVMRGDWNLYAVSGSMDIELPSGVKRESSYGFWQRKDLIDESLRLIIKSFGLGLNYLI